MIEIATNSGKKNESVRPTMREVARLARVSVATVSNVLNGETSVNSIMRERVEKATRELDYQPDLVARSLKSRRTRMLGMVISDITNPFFPAMVRGAEDFASRNGYLLTIFNTDDQLDVEKRVFSLLRSRRVDGVLAVLARDGGDLSHVQAAIDGGLQLVCIDRVPAGLPVDSVSVDNVKGVSMCVRHIISSGRRSIGVLMGSPELYTGRERLKGYRIALAEAGIPAEEAWIRHGDFRMESSYRLTKDLLLSHPRPTALFACNGPMGLGALQAIQELGLDCPSEVALAVFDDVPTAELLRPRLTVVRQSAYDMGNKATELLIARLDGELDGRPPTAIQLEPELIVRESTARAETATS